MAPPRSPSTSASSATRSAVCPATISAMPSACSVSRCSTSSRTSRCSASTVLQACWNWCDERAGHREAETLASAKLGAVGGLGRLRRAGLCRHHRQDEGRLSMTSKNRRNLNVVMGLIGVICFMIGLTFAAVPLYRIFCERTGYDGTPIRVDAAATRGQAIDRVVTVSFTADVNQSMPWSFYPKQNKIEAKVGETYL